jgi:hypothetical protein
MHGATLGAIEARLTLSKENGPRLNFWGHYKTYTRLWRISVVPAFAANDDHHASLLAVPVLWAPMVRTPEFTPSATIRYKDD